MPSFTCVEFLFSGRRFCRRFLCWRTARIRSASGSSYSSQMARITTTDRGAAQVRGPEHNMQCQNMTIAIFMRFLADIKPFLSLGKPQVIPCWLASRSLGVAPFSLFFCIYHWNKAILWGCHHTKHGVSRLTVSEWEQTLAIMPQIATCCRKDNMLLKLPQRNVVLPVEKRRRISNEFPSESRITQAVLRNSLKCWERSSFSPGEWPFFLKTRLCSHLFWMLQFSKSAAESFPQNWEKWHPLVAISFPFALAEVRLWLTRDSQPSS